MREMDLKKNVYTYLNHSAGYLKLIWYLNKLPWCLKRLRIHLQCGRPGIDPWVGTIPGRRAWQPTLVSLPGESLWTEECGGPQSMGSQRIRHYWATKQAHTSIKKKKWCICSALPFFKLKEAIKLLCYYFHFICIYLYPTLSQVVS